MGSIEQFEVEEQLLEGHSSRSNPEAQEAALRAGAPFKHLLVRSFDATSMVFHLQSEGGENRLGMCMHGLPAQGADDSTMNRIQTVFSTRVPANTFVQLGLFGEPCIDGAIELYQRNKSSDDPLVKRMVDRRSEFIRAGTQKPIPGMNDVLLKRVRVILSITIPCDVIPDEDQFKEMIDLGSKYQEGMRAAGIGLDAMNEAEYVALLRRFKSLYDKDDYYVEPFAPLREQVFAPGDSINFRKDDIIDFNKGQYFSRMLSVKHFPKRAGIHLMNRIVGDPFSSMNQLTEPYYISTTIHYPDQYKKGQSLRLKHAWLTKQNFGPMPKWVPILGLKKAGMDILVHEMDSGGATICEMNFTITLFARTEKRLNEVVSATKGWANALNFDMREEMRIQKAMFHNILPMNMCFNGIQNTFRYSTMAVKHAINFLPFLHDWQGSGSGGASIFMTRKGSVVSWDPHDSVGGYSAIVFASPGSGKSFVTQQLILDWMGQGARIWVLDQGRSMEKLCHAKNGTFIEFSEGSNICLNPFTKIENIEDDMDILVAMFAKMAAPDSLLDPLQQAALQEKLMEAWSKDGTNACVDTVARMCLGDKDQRVIDLGRQLYPYTSAGPLGRWFNGVNNVDLSNRFVVCELQELASNKALQQVVLLQLFGSISDEMYFGHGKKYLVIDESWSLLGDPMMSKAIEAAYRKVRKHTGAVFCITQDIASIFASPSGQAIINSSDWQLILQQPGEAIDRAVASGQLGIDLYTTMMMKSIQTVPGKYSEMMIRNKNGSWGVVKFIADRFAQILFSTKGWERDEVFARINAGENVVDVIDQYVMEGR